MYVIAIDPAMIGDLMNSGFILFSRSFIIEETMYVSGPRGDLQLKPFFGR